jgi:spermidine/putrescine transport system substrate-binding protein
MKKFYWMSLVVLGFGFVACTKTKEATKPGVVNLAIWSHFVTDEILSDFEKQTGLKVVVSNYASNEELLAKIQAGAEGYDVAVPSDYMVEAMRNLKLLLPLDQAKVANARSLDPKTLKKYYDPENKFSLPFSWGTTGIAYNQKLIKTPIRSWKDLFENKELTGKFTLLDDVRETLGAALKMQAYSLNSKSLPELE